MTAKVGYFDPILERELTAPDVAAIATIQICFYIDCLSETINRDCLNLWETIQEWSDGETDLMTRNLRLEGLVTEVKKQDGFADTALNNVESFNPYSFAFDYFEYMEDLYCNIFEIL